MGAYKISGGASGGFSLGASDIFSLAFSFMEFFSGAGQASSDSFFMSKLTGVLESTFKVVGLSLTLVTGIIDILDSCPDAGVGIQSLLIGFLLGISALAFVSFTPAGKHGMVKIL